MTIAGVQLWGWDATNKVWREVLVSTDGKLIIDPSEIFENPPTNGETAKAPQSDWAYDHWKDPDAHHAKLHTLQSASDHSGEISDTQHGVRTLANAHAHSALSGIGSNDHHARSHDHSNALDGSPIAVAGLPNLTQDKVWKGNASNRPEEATISADAGEGHITIMPYAYQSIGQGTWAFGSSASQALYFFYYNGLGVNGDNISYNVYLAAGTYTLRLLILTSTNSGILDVDIDSTEVASFDQYSSPSVYNVLNSQTGIVIASAGLKTLRLRVDGKNASSSGWVVRVTTISLWRTA